MQEELNQFERSGIWKLVPIPKDHPTIVIKWVLINKIRIKARLVAQGYNQGK